MENAYLAKILEKVKKERNVDFSRYRMRLLERRVMARVRATRKDSLRGYFLHLNTHPTEMDELMDALTINVTEFFRDARVFDVIEKKVLPELIKKKECTLSNKLNIWSCGCASGEEPYSMLMLIAEHLGNRLSNYKLHIHATDIDEKSLLCAQQGVFDANQMTRLSPERRKLVEKYFHHIGENKYWIRQEFTNYIRFKYHDVAADTTLDHMDIILCRNVFIYFDRELQNQVVRRFYDSLNRGGFYIMGNVESLFSPMKDLFEEYDREARIYVKK